MSKQVSLAPTFDSEKIASIIKPLAERDVNYGEIAKQLNNYGFSTRTGKEWIAPDVSAFCIEILGIRKHRSPQQLQKDREKVIEVSPDEETVELLIDILKTKLPAPRRLRSAYAIIKQWEEECQIRK